MINLRQFKEMVAGGKIFSVEFIKRTTGEPRKMVARVGVKKHLKGGTLNYNAAEKNLLTVFDMEKGQYCSIPVDAVYSIKVASQVYLNGEWQIDTAKQAEQQAADAEFSENLIAQMREYFK